MGTSTGDSCPLKGDMGLDFANFTIFPVSYFHQDIKSMRDMEVSLSRSTAQSWSPIDWDGSRSFFSIFV